MRTLAPLSLRILALTHPLWSQTDTVTLSGSVVDPSAAAVPQASVTVTSIDSGLKRQTASNTEGTFAVPLLPPGAYSVTVRHPGFATAQLERVVLAVGDRVSLRIPLQISETEDTVTVVGEAPLVRDDGAAGTVIGSQFVANQPLNGRSFQSLVELAPGVVLTATNVTNSGQFSVNGQRPNANYFTVDGVSANFGVNGSATLYESSGGALPAYSALGGTNSLASMDAVQEFRVQTSAYAPENGRQPGAQVAVVTRSGTNSYHGSAFDYLRNDKMDANDWVANANRVPRQALRQNDFGFVFGGPVALPTFGLGGRRTYNGRNRTFFLVSYEGLRLRQPAISNPTLVPTVSAREAATGYARDVLSAFPIPNGAVSPTDPNLAFFVGGYSNPSTLNATSFRIDQNLGNRQTFFVRFNYSPSLLETRSVSSAPNNISLSPALVRTLTVGSTTLLRPTLINELRVNQSRAELGQSTYADAYGGATLPPKYLFVPPFGDAAASGSITIGASPTVVGYGLNAANAQRQINVVETLTWTARAHTLKFGFDWRRMTPIQYGSSYRQLLSYSSVAQVMAGNIATANLITAYVPILFPVYDNYSGFFQDIWRAKPRLTVTYGLRYEVNPAPSEKNGNLPLTVTGVDNLATMALAPRGTKLYDMPHDNFAPRIGIAYKLSERHATVVRGGYGLFYDLGYVFTGAAFGSIIYPFGVTNTLRNVPVSVLSTPPAAFNPNPPYGRLFAYTPGYNLPYSHQFDVTFERALSSAGHISVAYVAAIGRRLSRVSSLQPPNAQLPSAFTRVDVVDNLGRSDYHSFQAQFEHRFSRGLQAIASYTFGKSLDIVSDETITNLQAPSTRLDPRNDSGPSSFDVRHAFSSAVSFDIPSPFATGVGHALLGGFGLDAIVRARSAMPVNVVTGTDLFGLGLTAISRPNVNSGVPLYLDDPNVPGGRRFNRAAFSVPPAGVQGTLGRNVLRGFNLAQADVSLRRQFRMNESLRLLFRADAFNVFNHANFANPTGQLSNATFGLSSQMLGRGLGSAGINGGFSPLYQVGGSRSMQLALKLQF
jgi:Carboxypeptidase regulatory-like domain